MMKVQISRAWRIIGGVLVGIGAAIAVPAATSTYAGAGDCYNPNHGCTDTLIVNQYWNYGFNSSDGNLNNNCVMGGALCMVYVNDNVDYLAKKTTTYVRFCGWSGTNAGGSLRGFANSSSWVAPSNRDISSVYLRSSDSC